MKTKYLLITVGAFILLIALKITQLILFLKKERNACKKVGGRGKLIISVKIVLFVYTLGLGLY